LDGGNHLRDRKSSGMKFNRRLLRRVAIFNSNDSSNWIHDDFLLPLAAGSVDGTMAQPGPGVRDVVDTNSLMSISDGKMIHANGPGSFGAATLAYTRAFVRAAGLMLMYRMSKISDNGDVMGGWADDLTDSFPGTSIHYQTTNGPGHRDQSGSFFNIHEDLEKGYNDYAVVLRSAGAAYLIRRAGMTNFDLCYMGTNDTSTPIYAKFSQSGSIYNLDTAMVVNSAWLPIPIISDDFTVGSLVSSGSGHQETSGAGSGGAAKTWIGPTWSNTGGAATNTPSDADDYFLAYNCLAPLVYVSSKWTIGADGAGNFICLDSTASPSNWIEAVHDGTTTITVRKFVAGSPTTIDTVTAAYSDGADFVLQARDIDGSLDVWCYYNKAKVGNWTVSDSAIVNNSYAGIISSSASNDCTAAVIWNTEQMVPKSFKKIPRVVAFGDSATAGTGASAAVNRWANIVTEDQLWILQNSGVSGTILQNTVQNTVSSTGAAADDNGRDNYIARIIDYDPDYVCILYGLNDLRLNDVAITAALFENDLGEVVQGLINSGVPADNIILGSPSYMTPSYYTSVGAPWNGGSTSLHEDYVAAVAAVATAYSARYADVYAAMLNGGGDTLISDGIHPNDAGHAVIAAAFIAAIEA
jgi:lysophospholipase L1-like esterase